jgi:hypothetical protein
MKEAIFRHKWQKRASFLIAPEWIRTTDLPLRRRSLYPTELRARDDGSLVRGRHLMVTQVSKKWSEIGSGSHVR